MSAAVYTAAEAKRLILAKDASGEYRVTGSLDLSGCDLTGVTLPASVGGWLDLSGCDLTGVTLPASVGGWLDLSGCDLTGVTLPASVTGSLVLSGAKNPDINQWWREFGEATERRCIAISDYALIQIGRTDPRFTAGCRKNLTVEQALAHWGEHRTDARAKAFRKAISALAKAGAA